METVQLFQIPKNQATKTIKIKRTQNKRKIVISTNWLCLFDFNKGNDVHETSLGEGKGIQVKRVYDLFDAPSKVKKVYSRSYKQRKNNPLETLIEISSQKLINKSFPNECQYIHIVFKNGILTIKPVISHQALALKKINQKSKYQCFVACSSGIDMTSLKKNGFNISSALEFRPVENRDLKRKSDLTESGALSVLRNISGINNLFNEDITSISIRTITEAIKNDYCTSFWASPQCDEFTPVKSLSLKEQSLIDMSSTIDMAYDLLRIINGIIPCIVVFENVIGWFKSTIYKMVELRLRRWGYNPYLLCAKATEYGGLTNRPRGYCVFTCLPSPFKFEDPMPVRTDLWSIIKKHIDQCRDVTKNKSIQKGLNNGRLRVVNDQSLTCPTILKSQPRQAADSLVIENNNRLYWPTEELLKELMGIDESYALDCVSADIGSEIIGQSVDISMHSMITRSVKRHIDTYMATVK